jgi:pSer/pThr/pTyr-binding forkhead associated (FHA) protein
MEKKGDRTARAYRIEKSSVLIGRGQDNDIVINHPSVSTRHARIFIGSDGKFYIEDLKSSNGVFVNRERIKVSPLKNGDEILFGIYPMDFVVEGVSAPKFEKKLEEKREEKVEIKKGKPLMTILPIFLIFVLAGILIFIKFKPEKKPVLKEEPKKQIVEKSPAVIEEGKKLFDDAILFKNTGKYKDAMESLELAETYFDEALLSDPENQTAIEYKRKIQKELEEMPREGLTPKVWKPTEEKEIDDVKGNEILSKMEQSFQEAENFERSGDSSNALERHRNVANLYYELKKISVSKEVLSKGERIYSKSREYIAKNSFEVGYYFLLNEFATMKKFYEENQIFRANSLCKSFIEKSDDFIQKNKNFRGEKLSKIIELNEKAKEMKKEISKKVDSLREEPEALYNEGVLLEKVGSYSEAIKKWKLALEKTHPDDTELIRKIKSKISQYEEEP